MRWVITIASLLGVVAFVLVIYQKVIEVGAGAMQVLLESAVLTAISLYLLSFLAILIFRYAVIMLYSFLEHIEYTMKQREGAMDWTGGEYSLPMVTLVVPAYNEGVVIQGAVRSLLTLDYPNYEVLVVDDGSTDDTYEKALDVARESERVPVRVITKKNGGKADALNVGMTFARGEFILNMDGDSKLSSNTLRACVRHFQDPSVGAVAGNVKVLNRENMLTNIQALEYVEGLAMARKAQSFVRAENPHARMAHRLRAHRHRLG
jgi:cellulose synthase/poly-beta-1,6-N-acetylglucosamine synthase-like glycosyltransferase